MLQLWKLGMSRYYVLGGLKIFFTSGVSAFANYDTFLYFVILAVAIRKTAITGTG